MVFFLEYLKGKLKRYQLFNVNTAKRQTLADILGAQHVHAYFSSGINYHLITSDLRFMMLVSEICEKIAEL